LWKAFIEAELAERAVNEEESVREFLPLGSPEGALQFEVVLDPAQARAEFSWRKSGESTQIARGSVQYDKRNVSTGGATKWRGMRFE
jgi:hypothetical protein